MEKILNFWIGIILFANLYYFGPLFGLASNAILFTVATICVFFFVFRYDRSFQKLLFSQLSFRIIILSLVFGGLQIFSGYEVRPNDLFRISIYTLYFGWTFFLFKNRERLRLYLKRQLGFLLVIIVIMAIFEFLFYDQFHSILDSEFFTDRANKRLTVSFLDPNFFAFALISFAYIFNKLEKSISLILAVALGTIILVNLTGSRLGLLLSLVLMLQSLNIFLKNHSRWKYTSLATICLGSVFFQGLRTGDLDTATILERISGGEKTQMASASANARMESMKDGIKALDLSQLVLPPGNLFFRSKWATDGRGRHYPHSTFLFLFVEYGAYVIWPFLILAGLYKKSKIAKLRQIYIFLLLGFLFLPNLLYYSTTYLIFFFIETAPRSSSNNKNNVIIKT